jgi:hypothetical protein
MPYFAISPPMLTPTIGLESIRGSEDRISASGGGGGTCISEPPISEMDALRISDTKTASSQDEDEEESPQRRLSSLLDIDEKEGDHGDEDGEQSRFRVTNGLGSGGYSVVVLVEDIETLQPFAMKVIQKSRVTRSHDRRRIRNELKVLRDLKPCPFLEKCVSAFESMDRIFFVMEFNSGGDLFFHLVRRVNQYNTGFKEEEVRLLLAEVILGLEHLHQHGYVHRDIKVRKIYCVMNDTTRFTLLKLPLYISHSHSHTSLK